MAEYEGDARIKRLDKAISKLASLQRSKFTGKLPEDARKEMVQLKKDLASIGQQLENGGYHDQLPLFEDVGPRKVVQKR